MDKRDTFGPIPTGIRVGPLSYLRERLRDYSTLRIRYFDGALRDAISRGHNYIAYATKGTPAIPGEPAYHYTKFESAVAILQSRTLRASRLGQMNDDGEVNYVFDMFRIQLVECCKTRNVDPQPYLLMLEREQAQFKNKAIFCLSFSRRANLLSQWVKYSDRTGCSLGFNEQLLFCATFESWKKISVVYDQVVQSTALRQLAESIVSTSEQPDSGEILERPTELSKLAEFVSIYKHPGFAEEEEVRLVRHCEPDDKFVNTSESGRAFIELNFGQLYDQFNYADITFDYIFTAPNAGREVLVQLDQVVSASRLRYIAIVDSGIRYVWP